MYKYLLMLFLLFPVFAHANETGDAIRECMAAESSARLFYRENHQIYDSDNVDFFCKLPEKNSDQWKCVTQSIKNGNHPMFSMTQCFRDNPKHIRIGINEQKNAMKIASEVVTMLEKTAQKDSADMMKVLIDPRLFEHNSSEWFCL